MSRDKFTVANLDYIQRGNFHLRPALAAERLTAAPTSSRRLRRINQIGYFDATRNALPFVRPTPHTSLLNGLFRSGDSLAFVVQHTSEELAIQLGIWRSAKSCDGDLDSRRDILDSLLASLYPAINLSSVPVELPTFPVGGLVLGMPSPRPFQASDPVMPIDQLLRALSGQSWSYVVLAEPIEQHICATLRLGVLNELQYVQNNEEPNRNPLAEYYTKLLHAILHDSVACQSIGAWRTAVYLLGEQQAYVRLISLWPAVFSGRHSLPEPIRVWTCSDAPLLAERWAMPDTPGAPGPGFYHRPYEYQTLLTSVQLAAYVHLPSVATEGFALRRLSRRQDKE